MSTLSTAIGTLGLILTLTPAPASAQPSGAAGLGTSRSGAVERSTAVDLKPASANGSVAFVGVSYRWQTLVVSAEAEKGSRVNYALRVSKRF